MAAATVISVEEYLKLTGKPNHEYRHGEVSTKAMPTKLHSLIQKILLQMLEAQGVTAYPELSVRLSVEHFLVPDVVVAKSFAGPYPVSPVDLCCEILSPEDRIGATLAKCEEYLAWGVPVCWVIDPERRVAWQYEAGGMPVRLAADGVLTAEGVAISLAELFARLPED